MRRNGAFRRHLVPSLAFDQEESSCSG